MLIDVSKIIAKPDGSYNEQLECDMTCFSYCGESYEISACTPIGVKITSKGNRKALISLRTTISLLIPCDRCLTPVEHSFDIDYSREIDFNENSSDRIDNMDELNFINGTEFDVNQLICDEIIIDFPLQVLCDEDCKGLCPECGINLNENECSCDKSPIDPRFAVLADLLNKG